MREVGKGMARRLWAVVLSLALLLTMVPTVAFAEGTKTVTFVITDQATEQEITDASITITAPETGVSLSGYTAQLDESITEISYTVSKSGYQTASAANVAVTDGGTINVALSEDTVSVTVGATGNGTATVNGGGSATVARNSSVQVDITPDEGWYVSGVTGLTGWGDSGFSDSVTAAEDMTIQVTFAQYLTVAVQETAGGSITVDKTSVKSGDTVTVTVTPNESYWITSVGGHTQLDFTDANKTGYSKSITITENTTLTAAFAEFFTVTVTGGEHGTVTAPEGGSISVMKATDTNITVSATPDTGYRVASVSVNGGAATTYSENDKTYSAVFSENTTVVITFAINTYDVTIPEESANGTVTADGTSVGYGSDVVITLTPDAGYDVDSVTVNGAPVSWTWSVQNKAEVTISGVTSNVTVEASFKAEAQIEDPGDITEETNPYAYIDLSGSLVADKYVFANNAAVTLTAATGYTGVRVNGGTDDEVSASLTFTESITIETVDLFDGAAWHRITLGEPLEITIDKAAAEGELIAPALAEGLTHYNSDVTLVATFTDISGISSVSYRVATNSDIDNPTQSDDVYTYQDGGEVKFSCDVAITVDAALNDCDDVTVYVDITDRAGNTITKEITLHINTVSPQVAVKISGQPDSDAQAGYFNTQRAAIITITDRPSTFDGSRVSLVNKAENGAAMPTITEWQENEGVFTAQITFASEGSYDWEIQYTNKAGTADGDVEATAVAELTSDEPITEPVWQFTCDTTDPTGAQIGYATSFWNQLLSTLSFHTWLNYEVTPVVQGAQDNLTTPTDLKVEYYKDSGTSALLALGEDGLVNKVFNQEAPKINAGEIAAVYARVTDKAGNEIYLSTDGIIIDNVKPTISLSPDDGTKAATYNSDVEITVSVEDSGVYSGIRHVAYWVEKDGVAGEPVTLFDFDYSNGALTVIDWDSDTHAQKQADVTEKEYLAYDDLWAAWQGKILIPAADYNSSNVVVHVAASDNAGVEAQEAAVHLDINASKPVVTVAYDEGTAVNSTYYAATRTATVTIQTRNNHFSPATATDIVSNSIQAVDAANEPVSNSWRFVDAEGATITSASQHWTADPANTGADTDRFTARIAFDGDANYTFLPTYTNMAGNTSDGVIYADAESASNVSFTVDTTKPVDCKITVAQSSWTRLVEQLTFGLYKNTTLSAVVTGSDALSGVDKVEYYKVSDPTQMLSEGELEAIYHGESNPFVSEATYVDSDELFVIYARITDKAGNYRYVSTEGFAVDTAASSIAMTADDGYSSAAAQEGDDCLGTYYYGINEVGEDGKIAITIRVEDGAEESAYSGIRTVDYYYVKDGGNKTGATVLYENAFTPATGTDVNNEGHPVRSDLVRVFESTIQVDAQTYNSDDVRLYLHTKDNAGNENTKYIQMGIDVTRPVITVSYDNNAPLNDSYFGADRYATVVITERSSHFNTQNATDAVEAGIQSVNLAGEAVTGTWAFVSAQGEAVTGDAIWTADEGNSGADSDTFTAYVRFGSDANYTFQPSYTDAAGNGSGDVINPEGTLAAAAFTVDATAPAAEITLHSAPWATNEDNGDKTFQNTFHDQLSYGIWSNQIVTASGAAGDVTSPIHKVEWVKATYGVDGDNATAYTLEGLKAANIQWNDIAESAWTETDLVQHFAVTTVDPSESAQDVEEERENDQQFILYLRVTDKAGNVAYFSTADVTAEDSRPGHQGDSEFVAPKVVIDMDAPENGIFAGDVYVAVGVVDPRVGDTYSGLKLVTYEVVNYDVDGSFTVTQSGTLFDIQQVETETPVQSWQTVESEPDTRITVDSSLNNSNNVAVNIQAVDNAGNIGIGTASMKIDITPPAVQVSYKENDADGEGNRYFKADRTMTITVRERNFDPDAFSAQITGVSALTWTETAASSGNGDDTKNEATVQFSTDGEYQVTILSCVDLAGNVCNENAVNYSGTSPRNFVIDKTAPTVTVSYDNNAAANGNYYNADRVATITVSEQNFDAGRVTVTGTATDDGVGVAFPTLSSWSGGGGTQTATLTYSQDALYSFDIAIVDQAGNASADYAGDSFYVDKTMPELRIDGVEDQSANSDVVAPVITYTDTNFNENGVSIALVGVNGGEANYDARLSNITHGQVYSYADFAHEKSVDDLYHLSAHVTDLAGNESTQMIFFSVNRFGSVYVLDEKASKINNTYVKDPIDVVVKEINPDQLQEHRVTLFKNDKTIVLVEGQDYRVDIAGGNGEWYEYTYTIFASNFADDGVYRIQIHSVDTAGNIAENTMDTKDTAISFGVDNTAPVLTVINLESGVTYPVESITVNLSVDDNLLLNNIKVYLDDYVTPMAEWDVSEITKVLSGEGEFSFDVDGGSTKAHRVLIVCTDAAGNETIEEYTDFYVTTNLFIRYFNNKPLFYGSIGGLAAVIAAVLFLTKTNSAVAAAGAGAKTSVGAAKKKDRRAKK